jgi:hypothetical protein
MGWLSARGTHSADNAAEVVRVDPPSSGSVTWYIIVFTQWDYNLTNIYNHYKLSVINRYTTNQQYTANVSPNLVNPGGGSITQLKFSNVGTANLSNISSNIIPDTAEVTGVSAAGSKSPSNVGISFLICNDYSPVFQVNWGTSNTIADFRNSLYPVKCAWYCQTSQYATQSSTLSNVKINITYRYDAAHHLYGY